jgi:F0F1-type ATP synthase assembly protein I
MRKEGDGFMWNNELISGITVGAAATVPIIVAIVQVVKMTGWIQARYAPIVAIGAGIIISMLLGYETNPWNVNILAGILYGLASSGLYSTVKTTAHAIKADQLKAKREEERKQYKK